MYNSRSIYSYWNIIDKKYYYVYRVIETKTSKEVK